MAFLFRKTSPSSTTAQVSSSTPSSPSPSSNSDVTSINTSTTSSSSSSSSPDNKNRATMMMMMPTTALSSPISTPGAWANVCPSRTRLATTSDVRADEHDMATLRLLAGMTPLQHQTTMGTKPPTKSSSSSSSSNNKKKSSGGNVLPTTNATGDDDGEDDDEEEGRSLCDVATTEARAAVWRLELLAPCGGEEQALDECGVFRVEEGDGLMGPEVELGDALPPHVSSCSSTETTTAATRTGAGAGGGIGQGLSKWNKARKEKARKNAQSKKQQGPTEVVFPERLSLLSLVERQNAGGEKEDQSYSSSSFCSSPTMTTTISSSSAFIVVNPPTPLKPAVPWGPGIFMVPSHDDSGSESEPESEFESDK